MVDSLVLCFGAALRTDCLVVGTDSLMGVTVVEKSELDTVCLVCLVGSGNGNRVVITFFAVFPSPVDVESDTYEKVTGGFVALEGSGTGMAVGRFVALEGSGSGMAVDGIPVLCDSVQ